MSEPRFTRGPWTVAMKEEVDGEKMPDGSGGMSFTGRLEYDRDYGVVALSEWEQCEYEPESICRPWHEPDAHLIAAAPDYFEGVQKMLDNEQCGGDGWWEGFEMLKAAHRKASGEPVK